MPDKHGDALLNDVMDELGHDVYYLYPDSRHAIPDAVILAIAVACVVEFIKGFTDLNGLGKSTREAAGELVKRWRSRRDLEPWIQTLNLRETLSGVLAPVPAGATKADLERGQASLNRALAEFGMDDKLAGEHAKAIRDLVEKTLWPAK